MQCSQCLCMLTPRRYPPPLECSVWSSSWFFSFSGGSPRVSSITVCYTEIPQSLWQFKTLCLLWDSQTLDLHRPWSTVHDLGESTVLISSWSRISLFLRWRFSSLQVTIGETLRSTVHIFWCIDGQDHFMISHLADPKMEIFVTPSRNRQNSDMELYGALIFRHTSSWSNGPRLNCDLTSRCSFEFPVSEMMIFFHVSS
jgi:hypothetical protein